MLTLMSEKRGFRAGLAAGRLAADQPVAVRRRRPEDSAERAVRRRDPPPVPAFVLMAVSIALILGSGDLQHALGLSGPLPEILGVFLSGVSVMMLKPRRR